MTCIEGAQEQVIINQGASAADQALFLCKNDHRIVTVADFFNEFEY